MMWDPRAGHGMAPGAGFRSGGKVDPFCAAPMADGFNGSREAPIDVDGSSMARQGWCTFSLTKMVI
jgi:hypothetical protein